VDGAFAAARGAEDNGDCHSSETASEAECCARLPTAVHIRQHRPGSSPYVEGDPGLPLRLAKGSMSCF
jgi:hypothetical protein